MSELPVIGSVAALEDLFRGSGEVLGADLDGYRDYTQRVFRFARALGAARPDAERGKTSELPPLFALATGSKNGAPRSIGALFSWNGGALVERAVDAALG